MYEKIQVKGNGSATKRSLNEKMCQEKQERDRWSKVLVGRLREGYSPPPSPFLPGRR